MKVSSKNYVNFCGNDKLPEKQDNKPAQSSAEISSVKDSSKASSAYAQAIICKDKIFSKIGEENLQQILDSILEGTDYKVYRFFESYKAGEPCRAKAGDEIPNWKNLYNERLNIACYRDKENHVESVYVLNCDDKSVQVYDKNGHMTQSYSPEEMKALHEYKYYPEGVHNLLRLNKHRSVDSIETLQGYIQNIDNCFNNPDKVLKTTEPTTVYRALQTNLTDEEKEILSTTGAVFKDKSFVSTSKNLDTAKRFNTKGNPILKITLPENSRYLDTDKLFNIDMTHWREQELLLNRDSEFVITGYDPEENIIEATYISG